MTRYRLTVDQDSDSEDPCDWGRFRVIGFNRKYTNYIDPNTIDHTDLKEKIEHNRAWMLDYHEHGNCEWTVSSGLNQGVIDFDTAQNAGILMMTDPEEVTASKEEALKAAKEFLTIYTKWCNGSIYQYRLEKVDQTVCETCHRPFTNDEDVESIGGIYDCNDIVQEVLGQLTAGDELIITGNAAEMIEKHPFIDKQIIILKKVNDVVHPR